jgi:TolB-like protein/tetratricopeptide (TPR) repeat protein
MPSLIDELKNRSIFKVGAAYVVVAWLLLQFTDLVFENLGAPDWVMKVIMLLFALGLPIALLLAWAFELTPDGLRRDLETDPSSRKRAVGFYSFLGLAFVAIVGTFYFTVQSETKNADPLPAASEPDFLSVAVLPFESFTGDMEDQYFADGLADTLLHKLASIPSLTVIARNSSFQFKGQNRDVREIGKVLGVPTVLEGSVQRQGNQVRIIAQLVSTETGAHLWSETFDDVISNIFELQDRIAQSIAERLTSTLSREDRERLMFNGTDNIDAYEALLQAMGMDMTMEAGSVLEEHRRYVLLQEAIELDPDYAHAWAALSDMYNIGAWRGVERGRYQEFVGKGKEAARRAIEAEPDFSGGYAALGFHHYRVGEIDEAERAYRDALERNPNSVAAFTGLGLILLSSAPEQALENFERARVLDPENPVVYRQLFFALNRLGRNEEGIDRLMEGVERFPGNALLTSDVYFWYQEQAGRPDLAAQLAGNFHIRQPESSIGVLGVTLSWKAVADIERARRWNRGLKRMEPEPIEARIIETGLLFMEKRANEVAALWDDDLDPENWPGGSASSYMHQAYMCLFMQDAACVEESTRKLRSSLDALRGKGMGLPPEFEVDYRLYSTAFLSAEERKNHPLLLEALEILEGGGTPRRYQPAIVLAQLGRFDAAVAHLEEILDDPGEGILTDVGKFWTPPDSDYFLRQMEGDAGYDAWLARFNARRDALRSRMLEMERDGQIAKAP